MAGGAWGTGWPTMRTMWRIGSASVRTDAVWTPRWCASPLDESHSSLCCPPTTRVQSRRAGCRSPTPRALCCSRRAWSYRMLSCCAGCRVRTRRGRRSRCSPSRRRRRVSRARARRAVADAEGGQRRTCLIWTLRSPTEGGQRRTCLIWTRRLLLRRQWIRARRRRRGCGRGCC